MLRYFGNYVISNAIRIADGISKLFIVSNYLLCKDNSVHS